MAYATVKIGFTIAGTVTTTPPAPHPATPRTTARQPRARAAGTPSPDRSRLVRPAPVRRAQKRTDVPDPWARIQVRVRRHAGGSHEDIDDARSAGLPLLAGGRPSGAAAPPAGVRRLFAGRRDGRGRGRLAGSRPGARRRPRPVGGARRGRLHAARRGRHPAARPPPARSRPGPPRHLGRAAARLRTRGDPDRPRHRGALRLAVRRTARRVLGAALLGPGRLLHPDRPTAVRTPPPRRQRRALHHRFAVHRDRSAPGGAPGHLGRRGDRAGRRRRDLRLPGRHPPPGRAAEAARTPSTAPTGTPRNPAASA